MFSATGIPPSPVSVTRYAMDFDFPVSGSFLKEPALAKLDEKRLPLLDLILECVYRLVKLAVAKGCSHQSNRRGDLFGLGKGHRQSSSNKGSLMSLGATTSILHAKEPACVWLPTLFIK